MPIEAVVVRSLVELSDSLTDDFDVPTTLSLLCERCAEALDVLGAVVVLETTGGDLRVVAASGPKRRWLELFERQGPWVDCYRSGLPTVFTDLLRADPGRDRSGLKGDS